MKKQKTCIWCLLLALVCLAVPSYGEDTTARVVRIYLDADMTVNRASGVSIEQGIRNALSEVDNKLAGREVELVIKDHHGNSRRSKKHLEAFLADDRALAVFSGLHSPPLLANREFINTQGIPVLDPWAALKQYQLAPAMNKQFNWGINENAARIKLRDIAKSGADCIFLAANEPEGKTFARAMMSLPKDSRLPIISHWGITGGDFLESIGIGTLTKIDLVFIQTSFSFKKNIERRSLKL